MNWITLAIIGHLANGAAFVIDKSLLTSAFKRSATYAGLIGILSFVVILAYPWVRSWPKGTDLFIGMLSGIGFIFALWTFFAALARAEASRVVPIIGSLIPVLTLLGTSVFLGERLTQNNLIGFALLVIATIILSSSGGKAKPSHEAIYCALASAVLFALSSVTAKSVYETAGFLPGFVTTRIAAGFTALILVIFVDRLAGKELKTMLKPPRGQKKNSKAAMLAIFGQTLGSAGFVLVQLATARGSAAIVNALQAVQYAFLVLAGLIFAKIAPKLLGEKLNHRVIIVKVSALAITAAGLALVV